MDSLPLCTASTTSPANSFSTDISIPCLSQSRRSRNLTFAKKPRNFLVFASKDESPKLDEWDQMELKFGKMLGEDPKLTLAKIMTRKSNPEMSYLEIEKSFEKKKGKGMPNDVVELPFDVSEERKSATSLNGLNLVRPVPKKGVKFESSKKSGEKEDKRPRPRQPVTKAVDSGKGTVPNVILRKPSLFNNDGNETYSRFNIRPNLSLKMGKEQEKKCFSDITLLKKPEPLKENSDVRGENGLSGVTATGFANEPDDENMKNFTVIRKPEPPSPGSHNDEDPDTLDQFLDSKQVETWEANESITGLQPTDVSSSGKSFPLNVPSAKESSSSIHADAPLLGKPKRLDESVMKKAGGDEVPVNVESYGNGLDLKDFPSLSIKEHEDSDWRKVEYLVESGGRADVEVISTSNRGFAVSFGSLIGFLPYRNLAAKWKFLAFESWLRSRGIDPSKFKQSLGVIGSIETIGTVPTTESRLVPEFDYKLDGKISPDMKLEDLLRIYDQEKLKFLSSFVGQRIKLIVVLADRSSRRLIFSVRPREKEELVEKKRNLMAKLSVGDVVKCCIKKISYFGIFVEVEEVPALIHQTEVSWDTTLDPATYFKVGQILEAKVHQLDFALERIFLSLKEVTPDPLVEALEAVVGDHDSLNGRLEAAQTDTEWAEVESLIKELEQVQGIQSVSKGRYFLSPGLAPTFQVYMALMFENQYKLLARSGNRAQEVIVQTTLDKEEFKSAILTCTNRVQ